MPPRTNVVISVPEVHIDAEAAECTYCDSLEVENKQLRQENLILKSDIQNLSTENVRLVDELNRLVRYLYYV